MKVHRQESHAVHFAIEEPCPVCRQSAGLACMTLKNVLLPRNEVHVARVQAFESGTPLRS